MFKNNKDENYTKRHLYHTPILHAIATPTCRSYSYLLTNGQVELSDLNSKINNQTAALGCHFNT